MTTWLDHLADDRAVRAVYRDTLPTLRGVNVHELTLHRDGPRVEVRLDLADYPATPPTKWAAAGFTTVQVNLMLVAVSDVTVAGWATTVVLDLSLEPHGRGVRLTAGADGPVRLAVTAEAAVVAKVSAYRSAN